jgi:hypothetical protein
MTLQELEELCCELLQCDSETGAILSAMSDTELQAAHDDVVRQYGLELVIAADEHSNWMGELLIIGANQGQILACQAAFYAILVEMDRRGVDRPDVA